jgi:ATP-dependent 26S proteasome regulatory subunit
VARVHQLLTIAVRRAPCLVFIDDLDALTSPRADAAEPNLPGAAPTLQKLLSGLDSLARRAVRVVVLGATRHPERLDAALLRPDRLGRAIALTLPDERERADIIALLASAYPELADLDAGALAARTAGASGAELRVLLARLAEQVAARLRADPESPSEVLADDLERALSASSPPAAPG